MELFRTWLDERGNGELADQARAVLTARRDYVGQTDPTCWRSGDIHDLMTRVVPAKMTDISRISQDGVAGLDAFLDFLEATGRLHPGSMHVKALKKELARVAAGFEAAMADRGRWRTAKTLYEAMRVEGVDITAEDQVQAWFVQFNQATDDRRRTVLDHLLVEQPELIDAHFTAHDGQVAALRRVEFARLGPAAIPPQFRPEEAETYRPTRLAPEAQLAAAARESLVLRQSAAFLAWVGTGRPVDKKGRLASKPATEAVAFVAEHGGLAFSEILLTTEIVPLTLAMGWTELRRTGLIRGDRASDLETALDSSADDAMVLQVWREALDSLVRPEATDHPRASDTARLAQFMDDAEPVTAWAMTALYQAGESLALEQLLAEAIAGSDLEDVTDNAWSELLVATVLRTRLHSAWRHGAIDARYGEPHDDETDGVEHAMSLGLQPWFALKTTDLTFSLSPLGTWGVREALVAEGNIAPVG